MSSNLQNVVDKLEEDIVFGRRRPRERLVEDELVAMFSAKKHIVRQALAELERMGLVKRIRNKGALVRDYTPEDVRHIFAMRELLEAEAARQIPLPADPKLLQALTTIHEDHSHAVSERDLARAFRANIEFHRLLFAACGNSYLAETIEVFAFKSHAFRFYSLANFELLRKARDDHKAMIDALKIEDREGLIELCIQHLYPSENAYINAYESMFGTTRRAANGQAE